MCVLVQSISVQSQVIGCFKILGPVLPYVLERNSDLSPCFSAKPAYV